MAAAAVVPAGKLTLRVLRGRNLTNMDIGKQDPYCKITIGGHTQKTTVIKGGGKNPEWVETLQFELDGKVDTLDLAAWDEDMVKDDLIGKVSVPLSLLIQRALNESYYMLTNNGKNQGEVSLACEFAAYTPGTLAVTLHSAKNIKNQDLGKQDPYVRVSVDQGPAKKSKTVNGGGSNPEFKDEVILIDLHGAEKWLILKLYDEDVGKDDFIGGTRVELRTLHLDRHPNHPNLVQKVGEGDIFETKQQGTITFSLAFTAGKHP